jgi:Cu2+-containing amine oxidase
MLPLQSPIPTLFAILDTPQGDGSNGLPDWTAANRNIEKEDVVLWHAFGVAHVPRVCNFLVFYFGHVKLLGFPFEYSLA